MNFKVGQPVRFKHHLHDIIVEGVLEDVGDISCRIKSFAQYPLSDKSCTVFIQKFYFSLQSLEYYIKNAEGVKVDTTKGLHGQAKP